MYWYPSLKTMQYAHWGLRFHFEVLAESFPSWDKVWWQVFNQDEATVLIISTVMEFTFQVKRLSHSGGCSFKIFQSVLIYKIHERAVLGRKCNAFVLATVHPLHDLKPCHPDWEILCGWVSRASLNYSSQHILGVPTLSQGWRKSEKYEKWTPHCDTPPSSFRRSPRHTARKVPTLVQNTPELKKRPWYCHVPPL